jgi:hypothetical protein
MVIMEGIQRCTIDVYKYIGVYGTHLLLPSKTKIRRLKMWLGELIPLILLILKAKKQ